MAFQRDPVTRHLGRCHFRRHSHAMSKARITKESEDRFTCDVLVAGGGPAGLLAALALSKTGLEITVCAPDFKEPVQDKRTTALMQGSVKFLETLDIWDVLKADAAPLNVMRLVDRTSYRLKAPTVDFRADELGPEPFGWNIPNAPLVTTLRNIIATLCNITIIDHPIQSVDTSATSVSVDVENGLRGSASLIVAADGRNSLCRRRSGIQVNSWSYPQTAIVACFDHSQAHDNVSTEFHFDAGPLTVVPLPGRRSSLVWIETPEQAANLRALNSDEFAERLEQETDGSLGRISKVTTRSSFPITGLTARRFSAARTLLVGEAAHVIPPIGAQGLNLGFRDVALAYDLVKLAIEEQRDPGGIRVTDDFDRQRRRDVLPRTVAVDILNRSLFQQFLPLQGARGLGLTMLEHIGPLRRFMMRQGIGPRMGVP